MSKLEETNLVIDYITKLKEEGIEIDNTVMLADIAKSLAMIADKLCGSESEDLGDYPDTIPNQFDNMTGSMNL